MVPVHLESAFALSVAQVLDAQNDLEVGGESHLVTQLRADKLLNCHFADSLMSQWEFTGVIRNVEMLTSILLRERRKQVFAMTIPACQVIKFCVYNILLNTLHQNMEYLDVFDEV